MTRSAPAKKLKTDQIRVRITSDLKKRFTKAADQAGLSVSSWLTNAGVRILEDKT